MTKLSHQEYEMLAIRQRMEGVLWEVLSRTGTDQAAFNRMMDYIMTVVKQVERKGYPRIGLGKTRDTLQVRFEGHTIEVPRSGVGVAIIVEMLQHREPITTIGMKGEPTQWHVDQLVKEYNKKQEGKPKPKPDVEINLKDLGI